MLVVAATREYNSMQAATCHIRREADMYVAMRHGRELSVAAGFDEIDRTRIEIVILELARNLIVHAAGGTLLLELVERDSQKGVRVVAQDNGPGIADIALAMRDGYSTSSTLGAGLPGVQRLMDEFAIESTVQVGTTVRATKWASKRVTRSQGRRI